MIIVGVNYNLFDDNFRVNHDKVQRMLTWGSVDEVDFEPAEVVEDLCTTS